MSKTKQRNFLLLNRTKNGEPTHQYLLNNKKYEGRFTSNMLVLNKNGLLYVEVEKAQPQKGTVLEFNKVPPCFSLKDMPVEGWKELPKDTCR